MIFENEIKAISSLNCITPLAYAGHGKDYFCNLIKKSIDKEFYNLSFSDPVKNIIAESFSKNKISQLKTKTPEYQKNIGSNKEIYHYFEYLKNDRQDIYVFDNLNMREFMILLMGKDFLLKADPTIKVKLACYDAIKQLEKKPNTIFLANSTRYEKEIVFSFLLNNEKNPLDFFHKYLGNNKKIDNINVFNKIIMNLKLDFDITKEDKETLNNISTNLSKKFFDINKFKSPLIDYNEMEKILAGQYSLASDYDKATAFGVFHIFRPLLPRKNLPELDNFNLDKEIINYTGINIEELNKIKSNYKKYIIDFNQDNIHNYGYLRSNPLDISEKNITMYKGTAFLNKPNLSTESIFEQLRKMEEIKEKQKENIDLFTKRLKNKNRNK